MNNQRQLLLGIFFIVALSLLAYYTLFLTESHLFSKPILMTVYFEEANNLREGDPVQLLGARIGRVKEVTPQIAAKKEMRIRVVLSLDSKVELVEGAVISIQETSLLGGRNVQIDPGPAGAPVARELEGGGYLGIVQKNPIAAFGDFGAELSRLVKENRESIQGTLANVRTITEDVKTGKGLLGRVISDEALVADVRAGVADARTFLANVSAASDQLKEGKGLAGALLYDEATKQKFADTLDNLRQLSGDLKDGQGILSALIYDQGLKDRLTKGIDSFVAFGEKLNQGGGTLDMLLNDEQVRDQFKALVSNLSGASEDVRTILADVKAGKGTLGKLVADEGLYDEVKKAAGVLTRSLEDYREAAPITAFTSVLFAAW